MRLVHAVLLPGIVVFVSKVNLLQAHHALRLDVAVDLATGLRGTDAEATADHESRSYEKLINQIAQIVTNRFTDGGVAETALAEAKELMQPSFDLHFAEWQRLNGGESPDAFFDSDGYKSWRRLLNGVNRNLPDHQQFTFKHFRHSMVGELPQS